MSADDRLFLGRCPCQISQTVSALGLSLLLLTGLLHSVHAEFLASRFESMRTCESRTDGKTFAWLVKRDIV